VSVFEKRNYAAWSPYVAEDCIFSGDSGYLHTKTQMMDNVKNFPVEYDHGLNQRDFVVHLYGDTAALTYRVSTHEQFTDTDIVTEQRATETFVKQNGKWLLVARAWTNLPINLRKPVAVDTSIYKDYVGQYEWRPLDDVETVSVKDGKLWTQSGTDVEEYFPLGADAFFIKPELGVATFSRDAQGRVTGYTYRKEDGQEIHVKKLK
jgi:ketosteroid isomerase-like protein